MTTKIGVVILAVLAPLTAEILNGSTRVTELGVLGVFMGTLFPYALLIIALTYFVQRSASPTSVLFLLPIAGIVIEGLIVKSFFNISFLDLSVLGNVGVVGGVQWPWTISLIASHAFVSFLVPLTIATYLARKVFITKTLANVSMGTLALFIVWTTIALPHNFDLYWIKLGGLVLLIMLLICLSRMSFIKNAQHDSATLITFFIAGFLFPILNWLTSFFLATKPLTVILAAQITFISIYLYFLWSQWFNKCTSEYKRLIFIAGYYTPFAAGLIAAGLRRDIPEYLFTGLIVAVAVITLVFIVINTHFSERRLKV